MPKIKPCKKCGSKDIKFWDCGYSSFNPGGGECEDCGFKVKGEAGCLPTDTGLVRIWNNGQRLNDNEKLKLERAKTRKLRKQLRDHSLDPLE